MIRLLLRRLMGMLLVVLLASFLAFTLLSAAPGDAASYQAAESASQQDVDTLRREMGLDQPLVVRYFTYLGDILRGDFGESLVYNRPVLTIIIERFGYTLQLALASFCGAIFLGLTAGFIASRKQGSWIDLLLMGGSALGLAIPSFWLALMLVMVFSLRLNWLPVLGAGSLAHLVLPATCLGFPAAALFARLSRASLLDTMHSDYVRTALGKGATRGRIWHLHVWPNSLIPVLTMAGLHLGHLLGGTFVIETLFAWPGLGRMMVQAIFDRDYPLLMGGVILIAVLYTLINLCVDLFQALADPRLRSMPEHCQ